MITMVAVAASIRFDGRCKLTSSLQRKAPLELQTKEDRFLGTLIYFEAILSVLVDDTKRSSVQKVTKVTNARRRTMAGLEKIWVLSYELTNTYIIPVRCFSCGKVVGDNGTSISDHLHTEMSEGWACVQTPATQLVLMGYSDSMERLGLVRYSCRPDGHNTYDVDWIEKLLLYNGAYLLL